MYACRMKIKSKTLPYTQNAKADERWFKMAVRNLQLSSVFDWEWSHLNLTIHCKDDNFRIKLKYAWNTNSQCYTRLSECCRMSKRREWINKFCQTKIKYFPSLFAFGLNLILSATLSEFVLLCVIQLCAWMFHK